MPQPELTDMPIKPGIFVGGDFHPGRARLRGTRCMRCAETFFPPRSICPRCRGEDLKEVTLQPWGKVNSVTAVMRPPKHYQHPYWLGEVDLPDGVRLIAQLVGDMEVPIRVGETVMLTTLPLFSLPNGKRIWGYAFKPENSEGSAS